MGAPSGKRGWAVGDWEPDERGRARARDALSGCRKGTHL